LYQNAGRLISKYEPWSAVICQEAMLLKKDEAQERVSQATLKRSFKRRRTPPGYAGWPD
jgi:hypothetical protein